jgi:hypothetical protein
MSFLPSPERVKRDKDQFVRLFLYAEPGFGKSYFADQFPNPFIINTDGNLPYYTAPGLIVNQWEASKNDPESKNRSFVDIVDELVKSNGNGYKTIVIDLIENIYELARAAKLEEFGINHESDAGGYGKGYQLVRDPFYAAIKKLYSLPLNILLLSHENNKIIKDRIGREYSYFLPNLGETIVEKLTGTGYTLRGYWKGSLTNDNMESKSKRMLSLSPKDNELHVARLIDSEGNPVELDDIELSYENFINVLKSLNDPEKVGTFKQSQVSQHTQEKAKPQPKTPVKAPVKEEIKVVKATEPIHNSTIGIVEHTITNVTAPIQHTFISTDSVVKQEPVSVIQERTKEFIEVKPVDTTETSANTSISDEKKRKIEELKAKYMQKGRS